MASRAGDVYADAMISGTFNEHAALVALLRAQPDGLSWPEIAAELLETGSASEVWERHAPAPALIDLRDEITPDSVADDVRSWQALGYRLLSILDAEYPARLRGVQQAPPIAFTIGSVIADDPAVSVVGSREASDAGLAMAADLARALTARHITVISGLARGVDTAAHRATLDAGGRTVAVIGTGISRVYPAENRGLQDEIADRGLVLSQFWPEAPPQKHTFLMRNATMSGYGLATMVVEAGETSGARAQARMAVEHGRQVILASQVVTRNQWAQQLVGRPGVHVANTVDDVMHIIEQVMTMWDELRRLVTP
jgi:DNA processing protein